MCHTIKTIAQTKNGHLLKCKDCKIYTLILNNLFFEFTLEEFENFKLYIRDIEIGYWEQKNVCGYLKRKIPVPTLQQNLVLMFNRIEVEELKLLVLNQQKEFQKILGIDDIDYTLLLN